MVRLRAEFLCLLFLFLLCFTPYILWDVDASETYDMAESNLIESLPGPASLAEFLCFFFLHYFIYLSNIQPVDAAGIVFAPEFPER